MEINAKNLEIGYGDSIVISNIDVEIKKGEITTIIGPNGSGKSTVLKAMTRLLKYQKGTVYVENKDLLQYESKELARIIGILPQRHSAPPDFKVRDLVSYGRMPYKRWYEKNKEEDEKIIDWAMEVTGVTELQNKSIQACSGGGRGTEGMDCDGIDPETRNPFFRRTNNIFGYLSPA